MSVSEVRYEPSRSDIWAFYKATWLRSLWKLHAFLVPYLFGLMLLVLWPVLAWGSIPWAIGLTLLLWAFMPVYPLLRYRPGERSLRLDDDAVVVTLAGKEHRRRWSAIKAVEVSGDFVLIVSRMFNAFVIPTKAFASSAEQEAFVSSARARLDAARVKRVTDSG